MSLSTNESRTVLETSYQALCNYCARTCGAARENLLLTHFIYHRGFRQLQSTSLGLSDPSDAETTAMTARGAVTVVALAVLLFADLGRCDPDSFDLRGLCGQSQHVTSSDLLTASADEGYSSAAENCQVKVVSDHDSSPSWNHIRVQVLSVDTDCNFLRIYLRYAPGKSTEICGSWSSPMMYEISSNTLVIDVWKADGYFYTKMDVSLLVTSYSDVYQPGDFDCDNGHYIDGKLRCDGYNNCGDNSDELFCHNLAWTWRVIFISGACALGVVILAVIIVLVRRCSRRAQNPPTTSDVVAPIKHTNIQGARPSYGAIPGSAYQPCCTPSPPPYSPVDHRVTMPPPALPSTPARPEPARPAGDDADGATPGH